MLTNSTREGAPWVPPSIGPVPNFGLLPRIVNPVSLSFISSSGRLNLLLVCFDSLLLFPLVNYSYFYTSLISWRICISIYGYSYLYFCSSIFFLLLLGCGSQPHFWMETQNFDLRHTLNFQLIIKTRNKRECSHLAVRIFRIIS